MNVLYYDNLEATPADDLPGLVEVERIYCFDWARFTKENWKELSRIYEDLPGSVRCKGIQWWFGEKEDAPPFLSASVEPPGLQVYGVLFAADWLAWDERFRTEAGILPMRALQ